MKREGVGDGTTEKSSIDFIQKSQNGFSAIRSVDGIGVSSYVRKQGGALVK